ncbi:CPBP family intramembrane glutamic endopeptidase [Salipiger mangrovisoli]|uniref:CPBP family intramembrane metalloprotease n=1 Tax=Salipiger mangrovisoli TaxID=2865933 RepID=A0ABR9WY85_9RHOB|nr:CPBP family intramembrane glutamic endopeptidase [Salipiger mangrovisoli]MBE9636270.1 CPBP family intramembrane metalloprotease [Salipiger mangrovisoli]
MTAAAPIRSPRRLPIALATLVAWMGVTIFGVGLRDAPVELEDIATNSIAWQVLMAGLVLVAVIVWRGWRDLGFQGPEPATLRLLWLPGLVVLLLFALALVLGLPAPMTMLLVLVNTLLVGFSEEVMFRGVLFAALRERLRIWPAILWTTAAFGAVHVLNGFLTGSFLLAGLQAIAACCSGLLLMALLLRTGSIWVPIVFHALWDWATFTVVLSAGALADLQEGEPGGGMTELAPQHFVLPFLLVLPNLLYGLWLLRRIHRRAVADEASVEGRGLRNP